MAANAPSGHPLHILRSQPSSLSSVSPSSVSLFSFLKPLLLSSTITTPTAIPERLRQIQILPRCKSIFASITHLSNSLFSHSFSSCVVSVPQSRCDAVGFGDSVDIAEDDKAIEPYSEESGIKNEDEDAETSQGSYSSPLQRNREERLKLPSLTVKERKELACCAHSLGKKAKKPVGGQVWCYP